jgi:hypothetical protein
MTLFKNIVSSTKPTTAEEIRNYFHDDERIKGKRLKSFDVKYDNFGTQMDDYTCYHNVNANHYNITAVFE